MNVFGNQSPTADKGCTFSLGVNKSAKHTMLWSGISRNVTKGVGLRQKIFGWFRTGGRRQTVVHKVTKFGVL